MVRPNRPASALLNPQHIRGIQPSKVTRVDTMASHMGRSVGRMRGVGLSVENFKDESHTPLGNKRPFSPLTESYTIGTLTVSSPHSCNLPNTVLENAGCLYSPALQFSDSEGAPTQFGQPAYEGRSADRAVPDKAQGIYNNISLPLSSPGRNSGLKNLEIPNRQ